MLLKTLPRIIEKDVPVKKIFESNIFSVSIDFDSWQGTSFDDTNMILPYHGSFFDLRYKFEEIFRD